MASVAICTAAYPVEPSFARQYCEGIEAAARGRSITLLVAAEHGYDAASALASLPKSIDLIERHAPPDASPADLRCVMLEAAVGADADVVVFCDYDDRLRAPAIDLHLAALEVCEISYGDLALIDAGGTPLGRTFFEHAGVPQEIGDYKSLLDRNYIGFSNSALRRVAIVPPATAIPSHIVAADWWFFTMLLSLGNSARRAAGVVGDYRIHDSNTLGSGPAGTAEDLRRRAEIVAAHFAALPSLIESGQRERLACRLMATLNRDPKVALAPLPAARGRSGVWHEDVSRMMALIAEATQTPV